MKLRLRGNSIRLRLSQRDLATLLDHGAVEERVDFPGGNALRYRLERSAGAKPSAAFAKESIVVAFPAAAIAAWSAPAEVSMVAECAVAGSTLRLLVEKDYQCLAPREDEDDADLFPNPDA